MSDEPDDEWPDEDEDEAETWCIQCHRYCWPDELEWKICQECRKENTCPDK
jgi:hypothetical protein